MEMTCHTPKATCYAIGLILRCVGCGAQILMPRANRDGKIAPRHQGVSWISFRQHGRNNKDFAGDRVMYECLVLSTWTLFLQVMKSDSSLS